MQHPWLPEGYAGSEFGGHTFGQLVFFNTAKQGYAGSDDL